MHLKDRLCHWKKLIEANDPRQKTITKDEFMEMAQRTYGAQAGKLTWTQVMLLAGRHGVLVPSSVRHNPRLMLDAHHWNLSRLGPES